MSRQFNFRAQIIIPQSGFLKQMTQKVKHCILNQADTARENDN